MRFAFVQQHEGCWPVAEMCRVLSVSRSGYYAWRQRPPSAQAQRRNRLTSLIRIVHAESHKTYGSPRVHGALAAMNYSCSVNFVAKLMRLAEIRAKTHRKFKCTTDSRHGLPVSRNLLAQDFAARRKNQVWVTDITYVLTREGWLYLSVFEDLYSRRIVGWSTSSRVDSQLVIDAMQMSVNRRQPNAGLIVHSDRGSQYCSDRFQWLLAKHRFRSSMSRKGNCWDNAPMESFFRTLKVELIYWQDYQTRRQARESIGEFIEGFYNRRRIHSTLGYRSPVEYEQST